MVNEQTVPLQAAQTLFASEGIPLPFIPESLQPDFRELSAWVYGTRDDVPPLYDIRFFVQEAELDTDDYVLIGQDGHGVNSYAMHYYLVYGPMALFIQLSWGGAYTDNTKASTRISNVFAQAGKLVKTAVSLQQANKLQNERIIIILSNLYDQDRWRRLGSNDESWHKTNVALTDVQSMLDSLSN